MRNIFMDEALLKSAESIMKAAETIATSTYDPAARSIFSPENLDEDIKLLSLQETPLRNRIPRSKGLGQAAAWKVMTSLLHNRSTELSGGSGTTGFFADANAPQETTQSYTTTAAAYKLLGRKVEVGGLAIAASKGRDGQPDHLESREKVKLAEVMTLEEEALIHGNSSDSAIEFDGILKQITTNSGTMTNVTASGIGTLCETLFLKGGKPQILMINGYQCAQLAASLGATGSNQQIVVEQSGAVRTIAGQAVREIVNPVNGNLIEVVPSPYMGEWGMLLQITSPTFGEDGRCIEIEDLIPMSRIDVASSNFSMIRFILEALVVMVKAEPYQYKFSGLATS